MCAALLVLVVVSLPRLVDNTVARRFRRLSDDGQIYRQALEAALKKLKNEK